MKGQWKVTSNIICGEKMYGVYRQLDIEEPDHSGNREFYCGYMAKKEWAENLAEELNQKEKSPDKQD